MPRESFSFGNALDGLPGLTNKGLVQTKLGIPDFARMPHLSHDGHRHSRIVSLRRALTMYQLYEDSEPGLNDYSYIPFHAMP